MGYTKYQNHKTLKLQKPKPKPEIIKNQTPKPEDLKKQNPKIKKPENQNNQTQKFGCPWQGLLYPKALETFRFQKLQKLR